MAANKKAIFFMGFLEVMGLAVARLKWGIGRYRQPTLSLTHQTRKRLFEFTHLGRGHRHAVALVGVTLKKVLVVVLGCAVV
jgi:hypothetical protein